ncbi:MAG: hypothetical protein WC996_06940 [Peptostreptococcales bacterium]
MKSLREILDKIVKGNKKKEVINFLISLVIILAMLMFFYNTIFKGNEKEADRRNASFVNGNMQKEVEYNEEDPSIEGDEKKLETILSKIKGVGEVHVMITYETGREIIPAVDISENIQTKEEKSQNGQISLDTSKDSRQNIVTVNNSDMLVLKEIKPKVKGVIIVAEGSNDLVIRNDIIRATAAVFDIYVDKIVVFDSK